MSERLQTLFPRLRSTPYWATSPADPDYNCIAWAAEDSSNYWWPVGEGPRIFWPPAVPREETVAAFEAVFRMLGYTVAADESLEPGFEKVALFANGDGEPTHAARQLSSGLWASKIGKLEDIEHQLWALEGDTYGRVVLILTRPRHIDSSVEAAI